MRVRILTIFAVTSIGGLAMTQAKPGRANPTVGLLAKKQPVLGLYAPANPRGGRGGGAPPANAPPPKTPAELAQLALTQTPSDFVFSGDMEGAASFDNAYTRFAEFVKGMASGTVEQRRAHPLAVKTPMIAPDPKLAIDHISRQLNLGVTTIVFTGVESADEVKQGLAAMRFKSKGGTRPDSVGGAPAYWGMSEKDYKNKADLWPLNKDGELVNWTIVESKEGLARIREIAAVKGIGVLLPGAGTLGGVFTTTDSTGRRVRDTAAWEAAIQQVLAACKEFSVPCGFPANDPATVELRFKQGFTMFIASWGDGGFRAVERGIELSGRKAQH